MALTLTQGAALLLALCFLHSVNARLWRGRPRTGQVMTGVLFGAICIVGMLKPLQLLPGVIVDARSVVLSMAALFGGPLTAAVATAMALATRAALGGAGVVVGALTILSASALGLAYRYAYLRGTLGRGPLALLLFGLLVHLVSLALFQGLGPAAAYLNRTLALPYLLVFSSATALLGWLLQDIDARLSTEQALADSAARLQAIVAAAPDLLMLLDSEGHYLEILSDRKTDLVAPAAELLGRNVGDTLPALLAGQMRRSIAQSLRTGQAQTLEYELRTQAGVRHFEGRCQPLATPVRGRAAVVFVARDRTEQVLVEVALRESEQRFRTLLSDLPAISVQGYRSDGTTIYWNHASERIYGHSAAEALGNNLFELIVPPAMREAARREAARMFATAIPIPASELRLMHKSGAAVDVFSSHAYVRLPGQEPEIYRIDVDISGRKAAEEQARYLAYYDALTGLPNRRLLTDRLQQVLADGTRSRQGAAVLFLDLDHFKTLNDSQGHEVGDLVLMEVARRLHTGVRAQDTVARLGGDEFVLLLHKLSTDAAEAAAQVRLLGDKLLGLLRQPYRVAGQQHHLSASIGATMADPRHSSIDGLLKQADLAMYRAKEEGRDTLCFFDPVMQAAVNRRAQLQAEMHHGLRHGEFLLHLQPQVDERGRITAAEVLVRWQHPRRGLVLPGEFIALAEESGLILTLGRWVLEQALALQARWSTDPLLAPLQLSVNVSARQFRQEGFVDDVRALLAASGAAPERMTLELTESLLLQDMDAVSAQMRSLRALGLRLALDDFGTGYSSLAYLKRLPLDALKIDQSFVAGVLTDPKDAAVVHTIITLARLLELQPIAEGVETPEQHDFLLAHGCRHFQGYLFCRPAPVADIEQRVRAQG